MSRGLGFWCRVPRCQNATPNATKHYQDRICNGGPCPCTICLQQRREKIEEIFCKTPCVKSGVGLPCIPEHQISDINCSSRRSIGSGQVKPPKLWFAVAPTRYNYVVPQVSLRERLMYRICVLVSRPRCSLPERTISNTACANNHRVGRQLPVAMRV